MRPLAWLLIALALTPTASAEVVRVEIARRTDVLGGRSFGPAGSYELIEGRILFAFDPANRFNQRIVDLGLAPRNQDGKVEAWADFSVLRPKRPQPDGVALFEVSNRGLKYLHNVLDFGSMSPRPNDPADLGDGLLLRLGLTLVWVGWQHDVPAEDRDRLGLEAPVARAPDGSSITGLVRADWVVARTTRSLSLAHGSHTAYPAIDPEGAETVLTVRDGRYAPRRVVPKTAWRFARADERGEPVADPRSIYSADGFEAGKIYELVYRSRDPRVAGLGLAAIRDAMSHAKYQPDSPFAARYAVGFGISQTGRLLRLFLHQGFNTDERGRKVFDGLLIHVAGGGVGSFNHRFAQPSRDAHRYDTFFYPTDLFPFASAASPDPATGQVAGLTAGLDRAQLPLVFQTNSGYEYWGRAASLIHTTADGTRDLEPPPNERIYHLAGGQHVPGPLPPPEANRLPGSRAFRNQPLDYRLPLRALLVSLIDWVRRGTEPPPSAYPRIDRGDLVPIDRVAIPTIADVDRPAVVHQPDRLDFGPRWGEGIVDREPPTVGAPYPVLVGRVDSVGNEVGGIRTIELEVPLATYFPWNLRRGMAGDSTELARIIGTWIPFPRTLADRATARDPRPAIATIYPDRDGYLARVRRAATGLVNRRMLLADDVERAVGRAAATWDWIAR